MVASCNDCDRPKESPKDASIDGAIVRSTVEGGEAKEIGKGRAGDRIAAAALGANHSVVAYLTKKKTTEGDQLQAFAIVDDGEPARLSDDGAGATAIRLVAHGAE